MSVECSEAKMLMKPDGWAEKATLGTMCLGQFKQWMQTSLLSILLKNSAVKNSPSIVCSFFDDMK